MRILLAVDSIITLEMLIEEMEKRQWPRGTRARVISVVEDGDVPQKAWREDGYTASAVRLEMRRRGEQIAALATGALQRNGIPSEVTIMRGDPGWLITYEARKWSADLILIHAHNRTNLRSWMLGSVAKSVIRSATCSVEVIRDPEPGYADVPRERMRILLATDGSESSVAATQQVAAGAWPKHTEVKVVSVVNPLVYSMEEIGLSRSGKTERAHRAINAAMRILKSAGLTVSGEVVAGWTSRRIVGEAKAWGANLIVVGKRELRGIERLLSGSVSEMVANRAHCSVNIIRGRAISTKGRSSLAGQSLSVKTVGAAYNREEDAGFGALNLTPAGYRAWGLRR
jgi:nucleotide-binding universal stress UspA family protein